VRIAEALSVKFQGLPVALFGRCIIPPPLQGVSLPVEVSGGQPGVVTSQTFFNRFGLAPQLLGLLIGATVEEQIR
jgi:hypothetical protein